MLANSRVMETQSADKLQLHEVRNLSDLPVWVYPRELVGFLFEHMVPYEDRPDDIQRGLEHALSGQPGKGGFILLAEMAGDLAGGLVMLGTGMKGYVPESILLFVSVRRDLRGKGIGEAMIRRALDLCDGEVKLHVEPDNPALRLYERLGFKNKYLEMRWTAETD